MEHQWHFRFANFVSALALLADGVAEMEGRPLSDLEKAGIIQRFEICWELGWKSLRDYLAHSGQPLDIPSPANVIRAAFAINLINDGDAWFEAMQARNRMAHEYDCAAFAQTVIDIRTKYLPLLQAAAVRLKGEVDAGH